MTKETRSVNGIDEQLRLRVQFWMLLGPLFVIISLLLIVLKASSNYWYLPLSFILGIPLIWKWRLRGLAAALSLLVVFVSVHYPEIPLQERFWLVGMSLSHAVTLIIVALTFDEASSIIQSLQVESSSRLDNLLRLDEKLKTQQHSLQKKLEEKICEVEKLEGSNTSMKRLLEIARGEVKQYSQNQEKLLEDLINKRKELSSIHEEMEMAHEMSFKTETDDIRDQMRQHELEQRNETLMRERDLLTTTLSRLEKELDIVKENQPHQETRAWEGRYAQLRHQFNEKSKVLDETRRELFEVREQMIKIQRERKEAQVYDCSEEERQLEKHLVSLEKELARVSAEYQNEVEALEDLVEHLLKNSEAKS